MKETMKTKFDILVVEDEPVVIEAAKKILTPEAFKVDEALDAETALQKLRHNKYKLILSDLMLPKISGFELIEIVKRKYSNIPIIAITGYATFENAIQSFKLGVFDFIPKPFALEELLGVVSRGMNFIEVMNKDQKHMGRLYKQRFVEEKLIKHYFLGQHAWAKLDQDGSAVFGVGETFPQIIGEIQRVDFPTVNEEINQGNVCVRITTKDELMHTVWAPLSGRVIENNHEIEQNPNLINTDPFFRGWLVRIIPTNLESELGNLTLR
jgi:CheY-like chemotaxis protein